MDEKEEHRSSFRFTGYLCCGGGEAVGSGLAASLINFEPKVYVNINGEMRELGKSPLLEEMDAVAKYQVPYSVLCANWALRVRALEEEEVVALRKTVADIP